jgi:hypothetical protein
MCQKTYLVVVGLIFAVIAAAHLLRLAVGATCIVEGIDIPMWPSALVVLVMGYLSFQGLRLSKKFKPGS